MKTALLKQDKKLHLTVIKNNNNIKNGDTKLSINTINPNFTYKNTKGETISPKNQVML
jgi:hypothetical protein